YAIGAAVSGKDANSNATVSIGTNTLTQVTVQRPPNLSVGELISPPQHVSRGQTLQLRLPVTNLVDCATAQFQAPRLEAYSGGVTATTTAPTPATLAGGAPTQLVFATLIGSTAKLGSAFLRAVVPYNDTNTQTAGPQVVRDPVGNLDIQQPAELTLSRSLSRDTISQGQALRALVFVKNDSGAAGAAVTNTVVTFSQSDGTFLVVPTNPSPTIPGGQTGTAVLDITSTSGTGSLGTKTVTVNVRANEGNYGTPIAATTKSITLSFTVQKHPAPTMDAPYLPATVSRGEVLVPVYLRIRNPTTSGAKVRVTTVTLQFLSGGTMDDSARYQQTIVSAMPVEIEAGATTTVELALNVSELAQLGFSLVKATATAVDANDGSAVTVTPLSDGATNVAVGRPVLRIAGPDNRLPGVFPARTNISTGQTVRFRLEVKNFGTEEARFGAAPALGLYAGLVDKSSEYRRLLVSGANAVIGKASTGKTSGATILFDVTPDITATALGLIEVSATVPATSAVDASDVSTSVIPPVDAGTFLLEQRVFASAGDVYFDPNLPGGVDRASSTTTGDLQFSRVPVRVRINNNNGLNGATMNVSAVSLQFSTGTGTIGTEYDISPTTVAPFTVPGQGSQTVTFQVAAKPAAQKFRTIWLTPRATVADANTLAPTVVNGLLQSWVVREKSHKVVGQPDFASLVTAPPTEARLNSPLGCTVDGTRLIVADTQNSRVLVFNDYRSLPAGGGHADVVLGHSSFTSGDVNDNLAPSAGTLNAPGGVAVTGNRLIVVDSGNNRVLIYNNYTALPATGGQASVVLGQPNFQSTVADWTGVPSALGLDNPRGVVVIQNKLLVSDRGNSRILVWDPVPLTTTGAGLVIGQHDFTGQAINRTGTGDPTALSLALPTGLGTDGIRLFVADTGNERVLAFFAVPGAVDTPASGVLGQIDLQSGAGSRATTEGTLKAPTAVAAGGTRLFVADSDNNRVVVYNNPPQVLWTNGPAYVDMVGQAYGTDKDPNNTVSGVRDAFSMSSPSSVATTSLASSGRIWILDKDNSRLMLVPVP
ncbi:MAG: NHL repeat-containing protein, partial [Candidatus Riflebacteria bacterium]|nr:NHL repeat-containing protein [Candidatus Riflebacteria bacterium]